MNRVWIEMESGTLEEMQERAAAANRMMNKLGITFDTFWVHEKDHCYCVNQSANGGYQTMEDNGHWFNLDFLGKSVTDEG